MNYIWGINNLKCTSCTNIYHLFLTSHNISSHDWINLNTSEHTSNGNEVIYANPIQYNRSVSHTFSPRILTDIRNVLLLHWISLCIMTLAAFNEACSPLAMPLKWLGLIKGVSQIVKDFSLLEGELNHIKALGYIYHSSWLRNLKDVKQWVSWQQSTAADFLALKNRNVRLLLIVSTSHVFEGGQMKPAEPSLPPKTRGHSAVLRDHGQEEKRAEGSFYLRFKMKLSSHRRKL